MNIHTTISTSEKGRQRKTERTFVWSPEKMAIASDLWCRGYTSTHIAKQFGVSRSSFSGMASRNPSLFPKKTNNGIPKSKTGRWTQANIDECIRLRRSGKTAKQISEKIGMAKTAVEHLIRKNRALFDAAPAAHQAAVSQPGRNRVHSFGIRSVDRHHISGEVHSMPRVSILNGKEG